MYPNIPTLYMHLIDFSHDNLRFPKKNCRNLICFCHFSFFMWNFLIYFILLFVLATAISVGRFIARYVFIHFILFLNPTPPSMRRRYYFAVIDVFISLWRHMYVCVNCCCVWLDILVFPDEQYRGIFSLPLFVRLCFPY